MPFFKSIPADAGPGHVFKTYPDIYAPWLQTSQALMNGPSPLSPGEREMIAAYVVGLAKCRYAYVAHTAAAYARGIKEGMIDELLADPDKADIDAKFRPLLAYAKKLTLAPSEVTQADADAVFAAGWDEKALHDAIAVTARMNFMARLVQGHGFVPMTPERAKKQAAERMARGYKDLYPDVPKK